MANPNKQWTAEDIEKIWNNTGNTAQTQSAPLPVLKSKSNSYKFKPYEDKQYTAADIEKVWKGVDRSKDLQKEIKAKATSAPAKNTKVPTREESIKNKYESVKDIDTRNVDRKTEADIKKATKQYRELEKKENRNSVPVQTNNLVKPSTRYSNQTAGQIKEQPKRKSAYDNDFDNFYEWRFNRADTTDYNAMTDTNEPHWLKVKEEIKAKNGWSDREFESRWDEYNKKRTQQMADEEVAKSVEFAKEHPVLGTLVQASYNPQTAIEGGSTVIQGLTNRIAPQKLPTSSYDPQFTGTRVKEAMQQSVMDNIDSDFGKRAYGVGASLGDMVLNRALSGGTPAGMGLFTGAQSAARNQMRALERGADADTAAEFGTAAGAVTGFMNSVGLDKALGTTANTVKGAVAKGAATEGLENLAEDAANLTLDAFINKDKSQLNTLHDYYVEQGLSDNDAWWQVAKDTGLDLASSALSGAAFGGLVRGAKNLPELASEIKGDIGNIADRARSLPILKKFTDVDVNNPSELGEAKEGDIAKRAQLPTIISDNAAEITYIRGRDDVPDGSLQERIVGNVSPSESTVTPEGEIVNTDASMPETHQTSVNPNDGDSNNNIEPAESEIPAENENPVETPPEPDNPFENDPEYNDYLTRRKAFQESQKGMSMQEMVDSLKELKAMDAEMAEAHPEWFENGKFIGSRNSLKLNIQFFAGLTEEKKQLQAQLTKKGLALSQKKVIADQINDVDERLKGLRKTITNTAVNAGIVTREQIANDPELKAIAEYVRHSNAKTVEQAQQNLSNNGEQIKNDYVSGKKQIKTDLDADQAMLLLTNQDAPLDDFERNSILKNLATNGTEAGQFIQALAKYSNTREGALISATKVMSDETAHWASRNKQAVGRNGKLAEALKRQGYDETIDLSKPKPTFDELRQQVVNTLAEEYSSIENQFTDGDIDYLAHMLEHNVSIEDLVDALNTKMATGRFGISDETQAEINRLFEEAKNYDENSQEYVEKQAEAFRLLAEEVAPSATPLEKFDAWRYMAMLGNPKTMLRNFIGNKMFSAVTGASNNLAAIVEGGVDKASKALGGEGIQRTKAVLNPVKDKALLDATLKDAYGKRYRQIEGSKYEKMDKDALSQHRSVFDSKVMRLAEKAVDRGISDTKAVANKYSTSMAGYMKANGITLEDLEDAYEFDRLNRSMGLLSKEDSALKERLRDTANKVEKAREYAFKQAEYATFHEDNAIADILGKATRKGVAGRILVEGLVPFKKTPANIVKSGVEYSPLGAIKSIAKTGKLIYENTGHRKTDLGETYSVRNPLTHAYKDVNRTLASDVIQSWAQTLTGTGLASLGYYLYSKGILHSSNKDEKYQDDLEGKQNYSIEINGKTYTIDWAVPAAMSFLLGAEVKKAFDENAILDDKWYKSPDRMFSTLSALFEPVIETSMLQGIENSLSQLTNKYDEASDFEKAANVAASLGANYLTQSIPTLSGQIARTVDNTRRSTDTNSEGLLLPSLEKQARKTMNKIPFLSRFNKPYVNARGEQQANAPYANPLARLGYQTLSPWYAQEIDERNSDRIAREAYNGLDENGKPIKDADVFANWKSQVKINGQKLNPDQMYNYRVASGQANTQIREKLATEDWFNNLSADRQTEILKNTNSLVDHIGKAAADPTYSTESSAYEAYEKNGIDGVIEFYRESAHNKDIKSELGSTADFQKQLYDSGNEARMAKYKEGLSVAQQIMPDKTSLTEEQFLKYEKYGADALKKELNYAKKADELGVSNNKAFKELVDKGVSGESIKKAYDAITSTKTGEDEYGRDQYMSFDKDSYDLYSKYGSAGLKEYQEMAQKNVSYELWQQAHKAIPTLSKSSYVKMFKAMDGKTGSKPDGTISQKELLYLFNKNNYSESQAKAYWNAFGKISGEDAWKSVPELKYNKKTNKMEWKAVSKKKE